MIRLTRTLAIEGATSGNSAPCVFAVLRLDEGMQVTGHVVHCAPAVMRIGMVTRARVAIGLTAAEVRCWAGVDVGATFCSAVRPVSDADVLAFDELSGGHNPLHVDDAYAFTRPYGRCIAHGLLVLSVSDRPRANFDDWQLKAFVEVRRRFRALVFPDDTLQDGGNTLMVGRQTPAASS